MIPDQTSPPSSSPAQRDRGAHWWNRILRGAARNVFWNYCGTATGMIIGFVITPLLVRRLGETDYGIWILLGSLVGYFNLLDLGVRGSVGRMIAVHLAREEVDDVRRVFTSSLAVLGAVGVLALIGTGVLRALFFTLFEVPPERVAEVQTALWIVGVNLALTFPLKTFDGVLWAHERFDLINWIDMPIHVLRATLTLLFVTGSGGLVALAWITLGTTVVAAAAKAVCCWHENHALRMAPRYVSIDAIRGLYNFGIWGFLMQGARLTRVQTAPIIIGSALGVPFVTPFALARRLQDYAQTVIVTGTGVFTPIATRLHAVEDGDSQRALFFNGGKVCVAAALAFLGLFVCFGGTFLRLWVGASVEHAGEYLVILAIGETLALSQSITGNMVLSKARHPRLAGLAMAETAISIPLAWALAGPFGVTGVCVGMALPQVAFGGIATMTYGCQVIGVSTGEYLRRAVSPIALRAVIPIALVWILVEVAPPASWFTLVAWVAVYGLGYVGVVGTAFVSYSDLRGLITPRLRHKTKAQGSRLKAQIPTEPR